MTPDPALGALVHAAMLAEEKQDAAEALVLERVAQVHHAAKELATALAALGSLADPAWVYELEIQDDCLCLDALVPQLIRARVRDGGV